MAATSDSSSILTGYTASQASQVGATQRGTKIVDKSDSMDKNSFLKILSAELSNQDPSSSDNDPTKYISQLAQFTSLEQMANLNGTMSLNSASSLIGKNVTLNVQDSNGINYSGVVKSANKNGDSISLKVQVTENGKSVVKAFDFNKLINVNASDYDPSLDEDSSSNNTSSNT
ncbi:MAG: flagellar hook capping FlgD N-terminal domain-containing protein [Bacillota bacterium]|nr:flagellar hook capping FlgD N-terminal domain-containing protein [Bacillota bacterium]